MTESQDKSQDSGQECLGCLELGCLGCVCFIVFFILFALTGSWVTAFIFSILNVILFLTDRGQREIKDPVTQETFISPSVPDDIDNLLIDIGQGEIKDPVTQETFRPGEMVHLCLVHRLAYHEDSWREMGCQCMVCGNNAHTRVYTLPAPFNINLSNQNTQAHIDWIDIESSADRSSSSSNTSTSTSTISPSVPDDIDNLLDDDIDLLDDDIKPWAEPARLAELEVFLERVREILR